jgi:colanic acid biosynthesis glycosyl transferase WcaI
VVESGPLTGRMRILILTHFFTPEPIPKTFELATTLRDRGHSVAVVTGFPNYPSGRLYPGYRLGLMRREEIAGVPVLRCFEVPYHGRRVLGRLLNYASTMVSTSLGSLFAPRADVIYAWHPPLTMGLAAWLIARLRRIPFVYDVQDIWPESALLSGLLREGWLVNVMFALERFIYKRAAHILVVTEGARRNLVRKGVAPEKITVMPHWVDPALFEEPSRETVELVRREHGWDRDFVILFAGNLGLVQGLETVVRAAQQLPADSSIRFVLVGDGADRARLQRMAADADVPVRRLQFIDRQPVEQIHTFLGAADALLVHLKASELSQYVIPTKTLAYLATGRPILMAMDGAAADLVRDAGAGLTIAPDECAALAAAAVTLSQLSPVARVAMGQRGRAYLDAHLTRERVIPQYEDVLGRVARVHRRHHPERG